MSKKPFQISHTKLKDARKKAGIKSKDFATSVDKQPPNISNYESGLCAPPANVLLAYLILCNAKPEDLLTSDVN